MKTFTTLTGAVAAACLALCLAGCPDEPDDAIFPDRDTIPEPTLDDAPDPYAPAPPAYEEGEGEGEGAFERAGEELDEAAEDTGEALRHGAEDAGDAAGQAGDRVEEQTDLPR